jgi:3-deoxy-7-phosphoheptulonate synthase
MKTCDEVLTDWTVNSWEKKELTQAVKYSSNTELNFVFQQLTSFPPLVSLAEILSLLEKMTNVSRGNAIILQAGDCAESFVTDEKYTAKQASFIRLLGMLLETGQKQNVVPIGRIAGQYAKPRSSEFEMQNGLTLPAYRGDIINNIKFDLNSRTPNPSLMLTAYANSKRNLDIIRAQAGAYPLMYSSHESLHLPYETALTRIQSDGAWYNLGAHFLWIGVRTSHLNSAHLEYIRGINNPIGVKISSNDTPQKIMSLVRALNPENKPGRLALIYRYGCNDILKYLPKILSVITRAGENVIWISDPMHGNSSYTLSGYKTRHYYDILTELKHAKIIHREMGINLGGIHLEVTHENVTECLGGPQMLTERDIKQNYKTLVDPRLNFTQSVALIHEYNDF